MSHEQRTRLTFNLDFFPFDWYSVRGQVTNARNTVNVIRALEATLAQIDAPSWEVLKGVKPNGLFGSLLICSIDGTFSFTQNNIKGGLGDASRVCSAND